MYIKHAKILNYRALQNISIPLMQFSVLLGENDVGKTSVLYALDSFFQNKKISDPECFFKKDISKNITIALTFDDPPNDLDLEKCKRNDNTIIISKEFAFDKAPVAELILNDGSKYKVDKNILKNWFSTDNFHFIPVRRDLNIQFSMNKTSLLGKTLRAKMKSVIDSGDVNESLLKLQQALKESLKDPQDALQGFLQEQLHNEEIKLNFEDLSIDPVEGIDFSIRISDDRVDDILIQN